MKRLLTTVLVLTALVPLSCGGQVKDVSIKVVNTYVHDSKAYTQGLFFWKGEMFESTGEYGESSIRKVELSNGKVREKVDFSRQYFAEGSCISDGRMYVLTWKNKVAFVYDPESFKYIRTIGYPRDGWGLVALPGENSSSGAASAEDKKIISQLPRGTVMIASDGTSKLYCLDSNLKTLAYISVTAGDRPLRLLNELEWIDGRIWANIYTTDLIVIINPVSGKVEGKIDCSSLIPEKKRTPDMDVLNGITRNPADGKIYLTGKNWPKLFEIEVQR